MSKIVAIWCILFFLFFSEEHLFSHEKKSTKTLLLKLCKKGKVKKKKQ